MYICTSTSTSNNPDFKTFDSHAIVFQENGARSIESQKDEKLESLLRFLRRSVKFQHQSVRFFISFQKIARVMKSLSYI